MTRADYERYVAAFNARDYDTLFSFFAEDVVLDAGGVMRGKQVIRDFYRFFHEHVRETVTLLHFYPDDQAAMADVMIRFEGLKDLTQDMLDARGIGHMTPVPKGGSVDIEFFIQYQQQGPLIRHIKGAVFTPAA